MTLEEINEKLAGISKALESIQWEKDKIMTEDDGKEIEHMIDSVDEYMKTEKNFGKKQLENFIQAISNAAKAGNAVKKETNKDNEDNKDKFYKAISKDTKIQLLNKLNGKYDELFQKQEAIKELEERFNSEELENWAKKKIENNEIEVNEKSNLSRKIKSFKDRDDVKAFLNEIKNNISEIEKLDKLKKKFDESREKIKRLKDEIKKSPKYKEYGEKDIDSIINEIKNEAENLGIKINNYNEKTFDEYIKAKKETYTGNNTTAKSQIVKLLNSQDNDVKDAIGDLSKVDPKDIAKTLNSAVNKKDQEIIYLNRENSRLKANIAQMREDRPLGEEHYTDINSASEEFSYEPTDEEIEESDEYKKSIENAIIPNSGKEKIEWRRNYLLGDKVRDGKRHPLAWLRSHFGGKILDNRISKDIEEKARESAKNQIISNKRAEEKKKEEEELAAVGRNQFVRELYNEKAARAILEGKENIADAEIMNGFVERMSSEEKVEKEPEK